MSLRFFVSFPNTATVIATMAKVAVSTAKTRVKPVSESYIS